MPGQQSGRLDDEVPVRRRRLAVLDRDIDAIIRSHARDRKVAAWLEDTAEAFEEIGEIDLALDWAKQATDFDMAQEMLEELICLAEVLKPSA